eukprot:jgi/Chrzof1/11695/Cz06g05210.t1
MNSVTLHMVGSSCLIWGGAFETGFGYIEPDYPRRLGMAGWAGVGWGGVGAGGEDQFRKWWGGVGWVREGKINLENVCMQSAGTGTKRD